MSSPEYTPCSIQNLLLSGSAAGRSSTLRPTSVITGVRKKCSAATIREHRGAQDDQEFLRPLPEQKQQEQQPSEHELHALPVEKDPVVLFARVAPEYEALAVAADGFQRG